MGKSSRVNEHQHPLMGFFGVFVLCRSPQPMWDLRSLKEHDDGISSHTAVTDGWQIGRYDSGLLHEAVTVALPALVSESGAPAIFAHVLDSDCVDVRGMSGQQPLWRACLGRFAMAEHLAVEDPPARLADRFLSPSQAVASAVEWARAAGLSADTERLSGLFRSAAASPLAEDMVLALFHALGALATAD